MQVRFAHLITSFVRLIDALPDASKRRLTSYVFHVRIAMLPRRPPLCLSYHRLTCAQEVRVPLNVAMLAFQVSLFLELVVTISSPHRTYKRNRRSRKTAWTRMRPKFTPSKAV